LDRETVKRSQGLADTTSFYGEGGPIHTESDLSAKDDAWSFLPKVQHPR